MPCRNAHIPLAFLIEHARVGQFAPNHGVEFMCDLRHHLVKRHEAPGSVSLRLSPTGSTCRPKRPALVDQPVRRDQLLDCGSHSADRVLGVASSVARLLTWPRRRESVNRLLDRAQRRLGLRAALMRALEFQHFAMIGELRRAHVQQLDDPLQPIEGFAREPGPIHHLPVLRTAPSRVPQRPTACASLSTQLQREVGTDQGPRWRLLSGGR